jgi:hypothetical protein
MFGSSLNGAGSSGTIAVLAGDSPPSCVEQRDGKCYYCTEGTQKTVCRCGRIAEAALQEATSLIPPECEKLAWASVLGMAWGSGVAWLFASSYDTPMAESSTMVPDEVEPEFPVCLGSPLVLDTAGDGIATTSVESGVAFDLMGSGVLRTAWVGGDDALLALDRDGNGRIDDGTELFGEVTAGRSWDDGFKALAALDETTSGGNGDGRVDAADQEFERLLLWRDSNHDGTSQAEELQPLGASVRAINLTSKLNPRGIDRHGNDLRLQGGFTRIDGSPGLLADIFFATGGAAPDPVRR